MRLNWVRGAVIGVSLVVAFKVVPRFLGDSIQSDMAQIFIIILGAFIANYIGEKKP